MLTMSYFSLLVNYYLYYYINHSRFWPILSRDLLRNKILQKRINNEKVTLLFTGVQIIKSNSIKLDFWSTPKGRFSMCWYIGACIETCRRRKHIPTLWCDLRHRQLWQAWIIAYHQDSHGFREIQQEDDLWKFVADYLEHGLHGLYGYVGLLNLCEGFVRWGWCDGGGAIALF